MAKKTWNLPSLFKAKELAPPPRKQPWQFLPSCGQQRKTLSFRAEADEDTFISVNSAFSAPIENSIESSKFASFSTYLDDDDHNYCDDVDSLEMFVSHGVRSERLLFEPGNSGLILEKDKVGGFVLKESVVLLALESKDPYRDFRVSMEEMVQTLGVKDRKGLEELLSWYLRVNDKKNHGFIMLAFVELLIGLATVSDSCSISTSLYCSPVSSFASSPFHPSKRLE